MINNSLINDGVLDWKELGLLVYLLSKPDDWEVSTAHLVKQRKTSRDGIHSILKRLCSAGYASRKPNPQGGWNWTIYDSPNRDNPDTENPNSEKPYTVNPDRENPTLVKTDKEVKTDLLVKTEEQLSSLSEEMRNCFDWAQSHPFWKNSVTSISKFIFLYNKNTPNGLRGQFEKTKLEAKPDGQVGKLNGGTDYAAYQHNHQNLSAVEQVRLANGLPLDEWGGAGTG